jgi:hypothetical protein
VLLGLFYKLRLERLNQNMLYSSGALALYFKSVVFLLLTFPPAFLSEEDIFAPYICRIQPKREGGSFKLQW